MTIRVSASGDHTFKCVFGHAPSQIHMCADLELSPYGSRDNLYHWGFFEPGLKAHLLRNKNLPASEFRAYFNSRERLTVDEQKAIATSPRLTKTQAKKLLKNHYTRNHMLADIPNLLRHDILPEILAAWGERFVITLSCQEELNPGLYRKFFEYMPKNEDLWREAYDDEEQVALNPDGSPQVRYPEHWEVLSTNPSTPSELLLELYERAPQLGWHMLFRRGDSLPIELFFAIPEDEPERNHALTILERRGDEVRAWLENEHPDMVDVPFEWLFEVLSPREW